jgi:hypothetical protein
MSTISTLIDAYSMRARLQPALLMLLPACAALLLIAPAQLEPARTILLLAGTLGGAMLLSNLARDAGKQLEPRLWKSWGGRPSVALLRHRDPRLTAAVKSRYHTRLSKALKRPFPTAVEEGADPTAADDVYEAANAWLLASSRDQEKFQALFSENVSYGFRRNLLGLRPWVLACCVLALATIAVAYFTPLLPTRPDASTAAAATVIVLLYAAIFVVVIRRSWVRRAADAYALRLLETADR